MHSGRTGFHVSAFGSENLLAALSSCSRHGFGAVEMFAETSLIFAERPDEFRTLVDIAGVGLAGLHSGGMLTAPEFLEAELLEWERMLAWVKEVGADYAIYYGGERSHDPAGDVDCAALLLSSIGHTAKVLGITFCYEPDRRSPFGTRQSFARLRDQLDPSLVRLSVDTAHLARTEIDPARFIRENANAIHVVHVRDVRRPETPDLSRDGFVDPGTGVVDLVSTASVLRAAGYDDWIVGVVARPHVAPQKSVENTARFFRESMGLAVGRA